MGDTIRHLQVWCQISGRVGRIFLGFALVAVCLFREGTPPRILAQSDCVQPTQAGCQIELGRPAIAVLSGPLDIHTWWLHLDTPGAVTILLANLHADYGLVVVPVHAPSAAEPAEVGDSVVFVAMERAPAGDYLISVSTRSGEVSEQPYLLLASWRPSPPVPAPAVPEARDPGPQPITPTESRPAPQPPTAAPHVAPPAPVVILPAPPPPFLAPAPPQARPPLPPAGLRATPMNWHTIRLDWTSRSDNVTGYFVDGTAGYYPVAGRATTINVGGLSPNTTYCFRVTAFNAAGEATSGETCATTLDAPTPTPTP
jgi:hypothetical protein